MQYIVNAANKKVSGGVPPPSQPLRPQQQLKARQDTQAARKTTSAAHNHVVTNSKATSKAEPSPDPSWKVAVKILSEESGIDEKDLTDEVALADIGIDSLLSLVLCGRLRDELDVDLPQRALFEECITIGDIRLRVSGPAPDETTEAAEAQFQTSSEVITETEQGGDELWMTALSILSEESGIDEKDLTDDISLADIGIDSLLSLVLCGRLRDELDVDLPQRALFEECITIGDMRLRVSGTGAYQSTPSTGSELSDASTPPSCSSLDTPSIMDVDTPNTSPTPASYFEIVDAKLGRLTKPQKAPAASIPPAWSMYLQGSSKRSTATLFLFPDGCGAATSYLDFPSISTTTGLVAFNSPFIK